MSCPQIGTYHLKYTLTLLAQPLELCLPIIPPKMILTNYVLKSGGPERTMGDGAKSE